MVNAIISIYLKKKQKKPLLRKTKTNDDKSFEKRELLTAIVRSSLPCSYRV